MKNEHISKKCGVTERKNKSILRWFVDVKRMNGSWLVISECIVVGVLGIDWLGD